MKKNKALVKRVTSFLMASVMAAGTAAYADEVQVQMQETFQEEETIFSQTEAQTELQTSEESREQVESQAQETETSVAENVVIETTEDETTANEMESASESLSETEESESEEFVQPEEESESEEFVQPEEESESEEETTALGTDEFEETTADADQNDSGIYEIGDEFVKTFSLDMTVDSNPIYLGMAGISTATGSYYDQLDATSKKIYNQIYEANKSSASTTKIKLNLTKIFENQKVTKGENGKTVYAEETKQAIFSWLGSYVTPAYLALTYDHPELVWLSGASYNIGYSVYAVSFPNGVTEMTEDIELAGSTFTLKPNSEIGVLTSSKIDPLLAGTKSQIDGTLSSTATRYDTVKAIHDKICSMVSYEDSSQNIGNAYYQTPYSLYYDADGDGKIETVCAGYAKMMKVQCDKYGIPCVLVTGVTNTGEYHMWNYIQMEDGVWYAVDVTWDDQSTILYDFFLVGSETYSSAAFGTKKFGTTHIPSGKWTTSADCVFKYPVFSETAYKTQSVVVKSGLVQDSDGVWRYYKNNQVDTTYTGLATSGSDRVYLKSGVQDTSYTSLLYNGGIWYYIQKGIVNTSYSGLAAYNGSWYYVKGGTADWTYTGLSQYNGIWYYVKKGSIDWDYTGLYQYNGIWFYIKNGALDWSYTGLYQYSGAWYYIKKGQVDWNYTGSCIYNGESYYVENGVLNWKYNSSTLYSSSSYAKDSMAALLSETQTEEESVGASNQYAAEEQPSSTETEDEETPESVSESGENQSQSEISSETEIETQTSEAVEASVSQAQTDATEQVSQETSTIGNAVEKEGLLEKFEQYLIDFIMYLVKLVAAYMGLNF